MRQWALFMLMSAVWGSSYFWTKLALRSFEPAAIVSIRMGVAALTLGVIVVVGGVRLPRSWRPYAALAALSVLNITVPFTILTYGQQHVSSSLTAVLSSTTPLFVFLYTSTARHERFTWPRLGATCLAFAGIAWLSLGDAHGTHGSASMFSLSSAALIVCSSAIFALGNVVSRAVTRGIEPIVVAFGQSITGCLFELPVIALLGGWHVHNAGTLPVIAVLWLGVCGSALTYVLYFHFIQTWGSTRASMNTYLQPIVGVILGVAILGDTLTTTTVAALIVVAVAVALFVSATLRANRTVEPTPS
jgi:drug/metabolite transporter (DMT)-like permease